MNRDLHADPNAKQRLSPAARDAFRGRLLAEIPAWYSARLHVAVPALFGLAVIVVAGFLVRDVKPAEWLVVPAAYLVLNAAEWRIHRDLLHRRTWPLHELYDRHTPQHHMIFLTNDMAVRSRRELRLVLIPAWGIVGAFLAALPIPLSLWALGWPNLGLLAIATAMGYVLSYEWLHLAYHLPATSWIGRQALVARLRRHHAVHHAPERMQHWNFNVTVPLWDYVRGTVYRGSLDPPAPDEE